MQKKIVILIILSLSVSILFSQENLLNHVRQISELIENLNIDSISILIEKSEYKLTIIYNDNKIKSYPVVFGSNPVADCKRSIDA